MHGPEVLIVGAGPVGLLAACLWAQRGWRVRVCERRGEADDRNRAIGIHRPGQDALDAAGIGDIVRSEALRLDGGVVRSRRRTVAGLDFPADRPVLVLPQPRTDQLLRARLHALDPDALLSGCTVERIAPHSDGVRVTVRTVEGQRGFDAALVVAADGVRSRIRADLGIGWRRQRGHAAYAMLDVADPTSDARAVLHCEPGGLVESLPLPGGSRRWVVREPVAGSLRRTEDFVAAIEERTGIRIDPAPGMSPTSFVAAQHRATRLRHGRVVLLGDAAHEVSPIGGQGMNLGWADAAQLVAELPHPVRGPMPDLSEFERRVRRTAARAQRRSAFYMSMGAPAAAPVVQARELLMRVLGAPPLRAWTAGLLTMRGL